MSVAAAPRALSCPRCGGTPDPEGGAGFLARCGSCGVLGRIDDPEGRQRLVTLPSVPLDSVGSALREDLERRGISGAPDVHARETLFVPYWRVETLVCGQLKGQRTRRSANVERVYTDDGRATYARVERDDGTEDVRREVQTLHLAVVAGCPLDELGLPTLDRRRQMAGALRVNRRLADMGEVRAFDPSLRRFGTFLDPLIPPPLAEEEAENVLDAYVDGLDAELLPGAEVDVAGLTRRVALLYYPVHVLRFRTRDAHGVATFDATTGALVSVRVPQVSGGSSDRRLVGILGLVCGTVTGALLRTGDADFVIAGLVLGAAGVAGLFGFIQHIRKGGR